MLFSPSLQIGTYRDASTLRRMRHILEYVLRGDSEVKGIRVYLKLWFRPPFSDTDWVVR